MISDSLDRCGLNHTEQKILLFLLEAGRSRGASIAKSTDLKRPTVYSALGNLERMGLVVRQIDKGVTFFCPLPLQKIPHALHREAKLRYDEVREAATQLVSELPKLINPSKHTVAGYEITTVDSWKGVQELLDTAASSPNGYKSIFDPQTALLGPLKEVSVKFLRHSEKLKSHIKEIIVSGPMAEWWKGNVRNPNHKIKEISTPIPLMNDVILFDGTVHMSNYEASQEIAISIRHKNYYDFMEAIFDALWERL